MDVRGEGPRNDVKRCLLTRNRSIDRVPYPTTHKVERNVLTMEEMILSEDAQFFRMDGLVRKQKEYQSLEMINNS